MYKYKWTFHFALLQSHQPLLHDFVINCLAHRMAIRHHMNSCHNFTSVSNYSTGLFEPRETGSWLSPTHEIGDLGVSLNISGPQLGMPNSGHIVIKILNKRMVDSASVDVLLENKCISRRREHVCGMLNCALLLPHWYEVA
jgi:hypothetical protein